MFVVYVHYLDGSPFYVGMGSDERANNFHQRSKEWFSFVGNRESEVVVDIVDMFADRASARQLETSLITKLSPQCNKQLCSYRENGLSGTKPLTAVQQDVYDFLVQEFQENHHIPTMKEIGRKFGYSSDNASFEVMRSLEAKGYLEKTPSGRYKFCGRVEITVHLEKRGQQLLFTVGG